MTHGYATPFKVKVYPGGTSGENLHNMEKVDAAVSAELHRIVAHLDTVFLTNILVSAISCCDTVLGCLLLLCCYFWYSVV